MDNMTARAEAIAAQLTEAGLNSTADPARANPPCVLVPPPRLDFDLACGATATWQLVAMAQPPAGIAAARQLADMLATINDELHPETAEPIGYGLPGAPSPVPAYLITLTPEGI